MQRQQGGLYREVVVRLLSDGNATVLEPGMVFHLPQPYRVPGEQTVATSETVLVTEGGCETLTKYPYDL